MILVTAWGDDGHINIKATNAADNGMTFTAVSVITNNSGANASNTEANYIQVDGDFGSIILGDYDDSAASAMDGALGAVTTTSKLKVDTLATQTQLSGIGGAADITWMSPSLSGFKVGVSKDLTDSMTQTSMTAKLTYGCNIQHRWRERLLRATQMTRQRWVLKAL